MTLKHQVEVEKKKQEDAERDKVKAIKEHQKL